MLRVVAFCVGFVAVVGCSEDPATPTPLADPPGAVGSFLETFDGDPGAPAPFRSSRWDVTKHSRDRDTWTAPEVMEADHGADCSPPPATHSVSSYEDVVFQCSDHVMTALRATGYGLIYLTPDHMVDFTDGSATIEFSMSTLRRSNRDWVDVWVSPYDDHLQVALQNWLPSLSGEPRNGVVVRMDLSRNAFKASVFRDGVEQEVAGAANAFYVEYDNFLEPSATRRDRFRLEISTDHLRFGMPEYDHWWIDAGIETLSWTEGVVQFGHHSYNPYKDCPDGEVCGPGTWHWDDISINPARPFSINPSLNRAYGPAQSRVVLAAPAAQNSRLRFSGVGPNLELSTDGGTSWTPARLQPHDPTLLVDEHFRSYFTPIPTGTVEVLLRGDSWWGGDWHVRDVSAWAR